VAENNETEKRRRRLASPMLVLGLLSLGAVGAAYAVHGGASSAADVSLGFEARNIAPARIASVQVLDTETLMIIDEGELTYGVIAPSRAGAFGAGDFVAVGVGRTVAAAQAPSFFARDLTVIRTDEVAKISEERAAQLARVEPVIPGLGISELHAQRHSFAGQDLAMAGRVTRVSRNVFGTNWYHLADGTGEGDTADLTVTSMVDADVGDVVRFEGTVVADKDLGFGYYYSVLLEDAHLVGIDDQDGTPAPEQRQVAQSAAQLRSPSAAGRVSDYFEDEPETEQLAPVLSPTTGIEIGHTSATAIDGWLQEHGVGCDSGPDSRRATYRHDCRMNLGADLGAGDLNSPTARLLMIHPDDAPISHWSITREFSVPADAARAYSAVQESLATELGAGERFQTVDNAENLADGFARFSSRWTFQNLRVEAVLLKGIGSTITVREIWEIPAATNLQASRPGAFGMHGAPATVAPVNPHIEQQAAQASRLQGSHATESTHSR
jgi:hypothetical protein